MAGTANTKQRRSRPLTLAALLACGSALAALVTLAAAPACLPDLLPRPIEGGSFEDAALRPACGDGIIAPASDGGIAESCDPGEDADTKGCKNCQITCEDRLDPTSGHCYWAAGSDGNFKDAVTRCKSERGHVVTLSSAAEADLVAKIGAIAADPSGYWVGLNYDNVQEAYLPDRREEPGFPFASKTGPCLGCFGRGDDAGVLPIADVDASSSDCVASRGGGWFQVPCSGAPRPTVCEREPAGIRQLDCIIGGFCFSVPATEKEKTYVVFVSAAAPDQAAETCSSFQGGSLVVFATREEREQVAHEILARYPEEIEQQLWIGLRENGGTWTWQDGVVAVSDAGRPLPWGNTQPSGGAGARAFMRLASNAYDTQLAYADDGGGAARLYICQRPAQ